MAMKQTETTLETTLVYKGRIIDLYQEKVRLPNGEESVREIVRHRGACAILAKTQEGKILLIRQYRKSLDKVIYEFPAGGIEPGEDIAVCAVRELEEETAYKAEEKEVVYLAGLCSTPGFSDEMIYIFYANNVKPATQKKECDADEFIEVLLLDEEEILEKIRSGEIMDAKTVCAFFLYQQYEKDRNKNR